MKNNHGFSLIEVLITLLLVCIGVLGMVALQSRTIQYTQDSVQRNTAAAIANDLVELMRANPAGLPVNSGFYKAAGSAFPALPAAGCADTTKVASEQLACWAQKAGRLLPGASSLLTSDFYVCRSQNAGVCATTGSAVEIQIAWTVKAGECMDSTNANNSTSTTCRYRLRTEI
ncbi:type IV pilus modification protein PilV [Pseudomonas sp. UL073]|uniref:Type IV pilus modification protein PilV n=1 Tax=Zestomonas insulae TaxID=2809017 RepID=A0ABS2IK79_9GAMM|nr:type IV pilus modification protein PilV [Pseudomonas insulae]MBM7063103.1 type IV pilus modification protein PilV [Pseudomonas insulae]